jgi:hypothetical protein
LSFRRDRQPQLIEGEQPLPILSNIPLQLSSDNLFGWLKMGSPSVD